MKLIAIFFIILNVVYNESIINGYIDKKALKNSNIYSAKHLVAFYYFFCRCSVIFVFIQINKAFQPLFEYKKLSM